MEATDDDIFLHFTPVCDEIDPLLLATYIALLTGATTR